MTKSPYYYDNNQIYSTTTQAYITVVLTETTQSGEIFVLTIKIRFKRFLHCGRNDDFFYERFFSNLFH